MKLGRIEKYFMNRPQHTEKVINQAEKLLQLIEVKEKQKFLEVGCGNGAVSKYIAKKYKLNVTGIDIDPVQIQIAKENITDITNIDFSEVDSSKIPFEDNEFDIILSFGFMHQYLIF